MIEQRSSEWFDARAGRITASRMCDVMAFTAGEGEWKSGPRKGQAKVATPLKARTDYIRQLATERHTGLVKNQVKAAALAWGQEIEPEAQSAYEVARGVLVNAAGFVLHPLYDFIGASPDFLVGQEGGGEIKCPYSRDTHMDTLLDGLPPEHIEQIQGGLWVTGRQWWDFVSFQPDFPESTRIYIQRVERDEDYIAKLAEACISLESEVQAILEKLQTQELAA